VGILGCGYIGKLHLQSSLAMDGVTVRAVADAEEANRRNADAWGVETTYADFADLLESEALDAAVIALPPFLHEAAVEAAGESGCDVFVEKPFARTVEEAERILSSARSAGIEVGVDHTWRYYPHIRAIKRRYDDGLVGHVPLCSISRINNGPFSAPPVESSIAEWKLVPEATGGGVLLSLGVHLFDVLRWFFGELEVLDGRLRRQLDLPFEDTATVLLEAPGTGTLSTLTCGIFQWDTPDRPNMEFRLEGVGGSLDANDYRPDDFYVNAAKAASTNVLRRTTGSAPDVFAPTFYLQAHFAALEAFYDAVRAGMTPPVSGADGLRSIELVGAVYRRSDVERVAK
jgi:predicted dehydrogenase